MSGVAEELLEIAARVAAQARAGEDVEAYALDEVELSVKVHGGEIESLSSGRARGLGIRVVADGRVGYAHTSDLSEEALREALTAARANATVGERDPGNVLPAPAPDGLPELPELYDPAFEDVAPEAKAQLALDLEAAVLGRDPRVKGVDTAQYGDGVRTAAIASSTGVSGSYRRCDAFLIVEVLGAADGATTQAYGLDLARLPLELDVERTAAEATERAVRILGGRKPESARVPVVLDPFATASLLGVLAGALNAEAVQKGRSVLADRLGERLGGAHLTLVDDGRLLRGPAAAPWDDEGVPTQRTPLVDRGVLAGFLHNTATATRAGTASTGNAGRSYRSVPGVTPTNLYLEPGELDQRAILERVGEGFYCQQVLGLHSGANPISGEFSVGAAGMAIRDGDFAEPVREASIASTLPQMLAALSAVGSDLRFLPFGGGMGGATLLIDEMALSGA